MTKNSFLLLFAGTLFLYHNSFAQAVPFDNLNANAGANKTITWSTSASQNGFGHRIYNIDPGTGTTDLRIGGRNNSASWTDLVTITSTGNVGIGTTTPGSRLVVNGKTRMLSPLTIGSNEDGPDFFPIYIKGEMQASIGFNVANQPLDTKVWEILTNVNRFRILTSADNYSAVQEAFGIYRTGINITTVLFPNGNVGIGTADTKGYKLAVNGSAVFTRAVVKLNANWPDFVFDDDYHMITLLELEKYVSRHKHLPDMPTAAEVQKEGLDLGEMNRKLLQKVEELTLYLVDMKKESDRLKQQNEEQVNALLERIKKLEGAACRK